MTDVTADISPGIPQDLAGRAALVTGASRGIGFAIARELLARGASVTITARKPDELAEAADQLAAGADRGRVLALPGNAGSGEAREEAVARTVERFGNLAILVNNTGINPTYGSLMDADLDAVRKTFDTNVVAALGFVQLAYKAWRRRRRSSGSPRSSPGSSARRSGSTPWRPPW
jgi:NAD(P)-dependent dehydrogenase (short-subunit alcohol dehydrogenase family)